MTNVLLAQCIRECIEKWIWNTIEMLYWLTLVEIHLGLDIPSIFQLIFKPNTHAVKRESNLFLFISLSLFPPLLYSCFKGWGARRWLKTHLKTHFHVSAAAFFHVLRFQVQIFLKISTRIWGELNLGSSMIQFSQGFFSACTLFSFYSTQRK